MIFYKNKTNLVINKIKFVQATVTHYLKKVFPKHKYMRNKKGQVFQEKQRHMQNARKIAAEISAEYTLS